MKEALKTILEIQELDMKMLRLMRVKKERLKEIEQIEALRKELHQQTHRKRNRNCRAWQTGPSTRAKDPRDHDAK